MTDVQITTALTVPRDQVPASVVRDGKRLRIGRKLKAALDAMVFDGLAYDDAARKADLTTRNMRMALDRPHVRAYLQAQKQVFRAAASSQNIQRLVEMRDSAGNAMAKLGAIKILEQIDDSPQALGAARHLPGVVIVIADARHMSQQQPNEQKLIDINANGRDGD